MHSSLYCKNDETFLPIFAFEKYLEEFLFKLCIEKIFYEMQMTGECLVKKENTTLSENILLGKGVIFQQKNIFSCFAKSAWWWIEIWPCFAWLLLTNDHLLFQDVNQNGSKRPKKFKNASKLFWKLAFWGAEHALNWGSLTANNTIWKIGSHGFLEGGVQSLPAPHQKCNINSFSRLISDVHSTIL